MTRTQTQTQAQTQTPFGLDRHVPLWRLALGGLVLLLALGGIVFWPRALPPGQAALDARLAALDARLAALEGQEQARLQFLGQLTDRVARADSTLGWLRTLTPGANDPPGLAKE